MNPFDVFDPSAALDPTRYAGQAGAARLLQAAQHFPGGPVALVLALFFAPVGPGVPAGVLLARHLCRFRRSRTARPTEGEHLIRAKPNTSSERRRAARPEPRDRGVSTWLSSARPSRSSASSASILPSA